jgi:hypothetical protein
LSAGGAAWAGVPTTIAAIMLIKTMPGIPRRTPGFTGETYHYADGAGIGRTASS